MPNIRSHLILFFSPVFLLSICGFSPPDKTTEADANTVIVTAHGAAGEVSGSLFHIEHNGLSLFVDIGLFYPDGEGSAQERQRRAEEKNRALPVDAQSVDAVILTHAHLDHTGRLLPLISEGFRGKVYLTKATQTLMDILFISQIRFENNTREWEYSIHSIREGSAGKYVTAHWNGCHWQGRISQHNRRSYHGTLSEAPDHIGLSLSPCRVCASDRLKNLYNQVTFVPLAYDEPLSINNHIALTLFDAGHIPGSASVLLSIESASDDGVNLLFSGDIGTSYGLLQEGPQPAPPADHLWVETTYGGSVRTEEHKTEIAQFQEDIARTLSGGGVAWIPAFALDRTQKVLFVIEEGKRKGLIPRGTRIIVPSPTANQFTGKYQQEYEAPTSWFKPEIYSRETLFPSYETRLPESFDEPVILITTSGMMDSAFSSSLLQELLPKPDTGVFIVGYQAPDTPGGQLLKGGPVRWEEMHINVRADVERYGFFSAHADARETVHWLSNQSREDTYIHLIHGDEPSLQAQKEYLLEEGFQKISIPSHGESIIIELTR